MASNSQQTKSNKKSSSEKKHQTRQNRTNSGVTSAVIGLAEDVPAIYLSSLPIHEQSRLLGDSRISQSNRQQIAQAIGRIHGNQYLQRVIANRNNLSTRQGDGQAPGSQVADIQRARDDQTFTRNLTLRYRTTGRSLDLVYFSPNPRPTVRDWVGRNLRFFSHSTSSDKVTRAIIKKIMALHSGETMAKGRYKYRIRVWASINAFDVKVKLRSKPKPIVKSDKPASKPKSTAPAKRPPGKPETKQERLNRQALETLDVMATALANADKERYSGIRFTLEIKNGEFVPGMSVIEPKVKRSSGTIILDKSLAERMVWPYIQMMLIAGTGRAEIIYGRDEKIGTMGFKSYQALKPKGPVRKAALTTREQLRRMGIDTPDVRARRMFEEAEKVLKESLKEIGKTLLKELAWWIAGGVFLRAFALLGRGAIRAFPKLYAAIKAKRTADVARAVGKLSKSEAKEFQSLMRQVDKGGKLSSAQRSKFNGYLEKIERNMGAAKVAPSVLVQSRDLLAKYAPRIRPRPGYFDIVVHGSPGSFHYFHNGNWIKLDHRRLATYMKKMGYRGGNVRLLSCETGASTSSIAQHLSNKLGVEVLAPSGKLYVFSNGSMAIGGARGRFISYSPRTVR